MIDELGNRTEYQYDAMNRLLKTIEADSVGAGSLSSPVTVYDYDLRGKRLLRSIS